MRSTALTFAVAAGVGMAFAQTASAADLPRKAPVMMPAPVAPGVDWSGFYIGAHVGGAWGTIESSVPIDIPIGDGGINFDLPLASHGINGFIGGGQIGFNIQSGVWVFGLEADASWTDVKGTAPCLLIISCKTEIDWMGTATARLGFTADKALVYVKGGAAFAKFNYEGSFLGGPAFATGDEDKWGWTVGAGVEYAFTSNWSAKIEYNYMDFGKDTTSMTAFDEFDFDIDIKQQIHSVKFGLNYKFSPWISPVSARY
jgi:outer membrane immunogenic protein